MSPREVVGGVLFFWLADDAFEVTGFMEEFFVNYRCSLSACKNEISN